MPTLMYMSTSGFRLRLLVMVIGLLALVTNPGMLGLSRNRRHFLGVRGPTSRGSWITPGTTPMILACLSTNSQKRPASLPQAILPLVLIP